ncbi:terpenoid synthase [Penicillium nucicola]|uniref:terpenoid synthase n=1 Tax=Penicillium nucicola TaxID=1850975 RepID=UPI0025459071|nr:terpenoid synthase [Penicillium nucicola]KAJ5776220.1 terpenoid synthase [Penicillium nucicola]
MALEVSALIYQAEVRPRKIPTLGSTPCLPSDKPSTYQEHPFYVDNKDVAFKHHQNDLRLSFLSDWDRVEDLMHTPTEDCPIYFPPSLKLQYDLEIEVQLASDIQKWEFLSLFSPKLAKHGINMSHYCAFKSDLSYDRRVLLHKHTAWIFLMDEVSEMLPRYKLHNTAGKVYLQNLKCIMRNESIEDIMQFRGQCPDELLQTALNVQRIFLEDLMPLKRKLLQPRHFQACIDAFDIFFDAQYEEGHHFFIEQTSHQVLKTRGSTVGIQVPAILSMTSANAELYMANDPCIGQLGVLAAVFHDIIGLYKDLAAMKSEDDGSALLNLVRLCMREQNLSESEASRLSAQKFNLLCRSYELFVDGFLPHLKEFYMENLRFCFNFCDYNLNGIMGNPNNRYGWKIV